tara:strand:- start:99 stop:407 length:309 start_codon:yes stop_codon:yes gene_type:complete
MHAPAEDDTVTAVVGAGTASWSATTEIACTTRVWGSTAVVFPETTSAPAFLTAPSVEEMAEAVSLLLEVVLTLPSGRLCVPCWEAPITEAHAVPESVVTIFA